MTNERPDELLDFEIAFYEKLVIDKPDFVDVLTALGDAYTKKGLYEKGLEIDKKLTVFKPDDEYVLYNFACSLSLTGRIEEAISVLKKAVSLGCRDVAYIEKDKDLDNVRSDPRYKRLIAALKRSKKREIRDEPRPSSVDHGRETNRKEGRGENKKPAA
ncbi:MAG: hypothetical protein ABIH01_02140 [Candidatus Omnitrophota bacterium]